MDDDPRMVIHRKTGKLEKFEPSKFTGFVRVDDDLLQVTTNRRGELSPNGYINTEINGHRFEVIKQGTLIALDITFDLEGKNPAVSAWAPKT